MEALTGQDRLGIAQDRLDDHGSDVVALALEDAAEDVDAIEPGRDHGARDGLGDAPAPRQPDRVVLVAELGHVVGRHRDQGVVVDAVVLALELHDLVAPGVAARDAHGVHRGLGPGHGHPCLADPAGHLLDELHRLDLVLGGEGEADPAPHPLVDVVVDARVAVAEDHRPVAEPQVDVLVAIDVPDATALATVDVHGVVAPGSEVRVGAAGHGLLGTAVQLPLAGSAERRRGLGHGTSSALRARGGGLGQPNRATGH